MRKDNELLAEAMRLIAIEEELEAVAAKRLKTWRYRWFHKFNELPGVHHAN